MADPRDRRDRALRPDERMPLPREEREAIERSIVPERDVPTIVPNQPGYPNEQEDAWRDARRDYGGSGN